MTAAFTATEQTCLETVSFFLDSLRDWCAIVCQEEGLVPSADTPPWLHTCADRLDRTLFAPAHKVLQQPPVLTPFRAGYALGLIRGGTNRLLNLKVPPEVRAAAKKIRLSKKARKELIRRWEAFLIDVKIIARKNGRLDFTFRRDLAQLERICKGYRDRDAIDYHRGLADGLCGFGHGVPGDQSNLATEVYLHLVIWWRFVVRFNTVTELHAWLERILGKRAGDLSRTARLCGRLKLKLHDRGAPKLLALAPAT